MLYMKCYCYDNFTETIMSKVKAWLPEVEEVPNLNAVMKLCLIGDVLEYDELDNIPNKVECHDLC